MNYYLYKVRHYFMPLLLLCAACAQAQNDQIYIDGVYVICGGSTTQWYGNVELGPNAQLYIEDGEKAYFYGDTFKIAPTAQIYGANSTWTVFTQGGGTGNIVFKKANPMNNSTSAQYLDAGNVTINSLDIDNIADLVLINTNVRIGTNLTFSKGHIWCGANNLVLSGTATITGADQTKYVVTNSTGSLAKEGLGNVPFTFPVGYTADPLIGGTPTGYLPATLTNAGTADRYEVRAINAVSPVPSNPAQLLTSSWQIKESVPGGSNVTLGLQHNAATNQGISYSDLAATVLTASPATTWAAASPFIMVNGVGSVPGSSSKSLGGITDFTTNTYFTKGQTPINLGIYVDVKVYLQGAWDGSTGMTNKLTTLGLVPRVHPYNTAPFSYPGLDSLINPLPPGNVTDWVLVELRDPFNPASVVGTRAGLLLQNGHVVDVDGITPLHFSQPPGSYHIAVRHRNHLGIRTATPSTFNLANLLPATPYTYDFTDAQSKAYQNPAITSNAAQVALGGGAFGMWGGNGTSDGNVRYTGLFNDEIYLSGTALGGMLTNPLYPVYHNADYNMNGEVSYTGPANDESFLVSTALGGILTNVLIQHQ